MTPTPAVKPPDANDETGDAKSGPLKTCPKCGKSESWGTGSWCPNCGYYPAFEKDRDRVREGLYASGQVSTRKRRKQVQVREGTVAEEEFVPLKSPWVWLNALGAVVIIGLTFGFSSLLHPHSPLRGEWALVQKAAGGLMFLYANVCVFGPAIRNRTSSVWSIFRHPAAVWKPVFRDMPDSAPRTWMLVWGMATFLSAVLFIGG